jgi:hypothetical protein
MPSGRLQDLGTLESDLLGAIVLRERHAWRDRKVGSAPKGTEDSNVTRLSVEDVLNRYEMFIDVLSLDSKGTVASTRVTDLYLLGFMDNKVLSYREHVSSGFGVIDVWRVAVSRTQSGGKDE